VTDVVLLERAAVSVDTGADRWVLARRRTILISAVTV
jgi:hypothetical protein